MLPTNNPPPTATRAAQVQPHVQDTAQDTVQETAQDHVQLAAWSVNVQLFAGAAAAVGARQVCVQLASGATIADLSESIGAAYPQLQSLLPHSRWAIGDQFVSPEQCISTDEQRPIAMIPPVSGG